MKLVKPSKTATPEERKLLESLKERMILIGFMELNRRNLKDEKQKEIQLKAIKEVKRQIYFDVLFFAKDRKLKACV